MIAKLKRRNQRRNDELSRLRGPHERIAVLLDQWVQRNFATEGKLVGGWKPLALGGRWVRDVAGRRKFFDPSAKILRDTTRLQHSFLPFATDKSAGIGSDVSYSEMHEKGLDGLPVRRMLPKLREVKLMIDNVYDDYIKQGLRKK